MKNERDEVLHAQLNTMAQFIESVPDMVERIRALELVSETQERSKQTIFRYLDHGAHETELKKAIKAIYLANYYAGVTVDD